MVSMVSATLTFEVVIRSTEILWRARILNTSPRKPRAYSYSGCAASIGFLRRSAGARNSGRYSVVLHPAGVPSAAGSLLEPTNTGISLEYRCATLAAGWPGATLWHRRWPFRRFFEGDSIDAFGQRHHAWIGGIDAWHISPNINLADMQRFAQQCGGVIAITTLGVVIRPFGSLPIKP